MNTPMRGDKARITEKRIVVGFDGFVDTIVRPVRQAASEGRPAQPFATIREFGEFLVSKAEKSCSVELMTQARQLGGNLPYLSRAASRLGMTVSCLGMLGEPDAVEPVFQDMHCTLYPFMPPGQSTCMEFQDGKVLLASDCTPPGDPWQRILEVTGGRAPMLLREADLAALVNWSELSFAHALWKTVYEEAMAPDVCDKARFAFFDLCDCSRRATTEIDAVLRLIGDFARRRTTILSLNENEAHVTAERLLDGETNLVEIGRALRTRYGIDEVLIHTLRESLLISVRGAVREATDFVEHPKISTGAGDHFNAAACCGAVMGWDDRERLRFANCFASRYVATGKTPGWDDLE